MNKQIKYLFQLKTNNIILTVYFTMLFSMVYSQECITTFDLNNWAVKGAPGADWRPTGSNIVINNSYIFPSTFFVSPLNMINVLIKGTMSVETGQDDDFFGIVFGYKKPTQIADDNSFQFFLFDWKAADEVFMGHKAYEGFRLSSYNGFISAENQGKYFWGVKNDPPIRNLIKTKYGETLGWEQGKKYQFELIYTTSSFSIKIDDEMIFERSGCFSSGKLGFYCMSQTLTRFENFSYQSIVNFVPDKETACIEEPIKFTSFNLECSPLPDFIESMNWDFGDGQTSTEINPEHSYSEAGEYSVKLIVLKTDDCNDTIIKTITIKPSPIVNLRNDTIVPACSSLSFDAANSGSLFLWSTGEESQSIEIEILNKDTTIWVMVDKNACLAGDTVIIEVEPTQNQLYFPTAFSPNGDDINDLFVPLGNTEDVSLFQFSIFNRWGQMIFETDNPFEGWDGKYSGNTSPMGVYTYKVTYRMGKFCSEIKDYSEINTVTLVK